MADGTWTLLFLAGLNLLCVVIAPWAALPVFTMVMNGFAAMFILGVAVFIND